jgi:hypothetical protein
MHDMSFTVSANCKEEKVEPSKKKVTRLAYMPERAVGFPHSFSTEPMLYQMSGRALTI